MSKLRVSIACAIGALITALVIGFPKSPVVIPPANPNDDERLPDGIDRRVLIIGKSPVVIPPANPDDDERLPDGIDRRVLIIGGGVAGMSAALELAERGFNVTIREAWGQLGGRIQTYPIQKLNRTFHIDVGQLGVFHNYHQFHDIQKRLGVQDNFYHVDAMDIEFRNYEREHIYTWEPWPFNIMGMIMRSPNLSILQSMYWIHAAMDFVTFDYTEIYNKFDHMNFDDYDKFRNLHKPFADIILRPPLQVSFNDPGEFSAAEFLLFSHFFSISNPKASRKALAVTNSQEAILDAWRKKLESLGVRIELNTTAEGLLIHPKTHHIMAEFSSPDDMYDHTIIATDLQALKHILHNTIAMQTPGKEVFDILANISNSGIKNLSQAPPYKLLWVWFDKQLEDTDAPVVLQTPEFSPLTMVTQVHLLQDEYRKWANETGGSVFMFSMYAWQYGFNVQDAHLLDFIAARVNDVYPEIFERKFTVLDFHVHTGITHPAFLKDMEQYRPGVSCPKEMGIPNLYFAGDWLHTDYPSVFMERAVSTGTEAANQVLLSDHVRQVPLTVTNNRGPAIF